MGKTLEDIGLDILAAARSELYLHMPFLDAALCALTPKPGGARTASAATDGEFLYYSGSFLAERFLRSGILINRLYLHMLLHCLLRHPWKKRGRQAPLWDLACDIAVESILDDWKDPAIDTGNSRPGTRLQVYGHFRQEMPVLTAEGIYRELLRQQLPDYETARLQRAFLEDDHGLWAPEGREQQERTDRRDQNWKKLSQRTQTGLQTAMAGRATGAEAVTEQLSVASREDVDYRDFLRRFAVHREVMAVDGDAFDYGFYSYGLRLYGNLPLIEPPETREERRIQDFVIAVDTSMSTSGALVRQFLSSTYAILRSTETFTKKVNIRILQCDDHLRSDVEIHSLDELEDYMHHFSLTGGSATDFRPVFAHVAALQAEGKLKGLRGLLYFTDGMGIYPKKRPPYETAFITLEKPSLVIQPPPWAIHLDLSRGELEQATVEAGVPADLLPETGPEPADPDWLETLADLPEL